MDLIAEQARIEARMTALGVERFYRHANDSRQDGQATLGKTVQFTLDASLRPFAEAIDEFVVGAKSGRAGRKHTAVAKLGGLDTKEVAYIATKIILDGLVKEQRMTLLATRIGAKIEMEQRLRAFAQANPKAFNATTKVLDKQTSHLGHRERVYAAMLRFNGDNWTAWTTRDTLLVGTKLVEMFVTATGLIEIKSERRGRKTHSVVIATPRFKVWLAQLDQEAALLEPEMLPCVIPPKDWTGLEGGGYHTEALLEPLTLVKTRSKDHLAVLDKADLTVVFEAVNAIQQTPWAVNQTVLSVAEEMVKWISPPAGLPPAEDLELPGKPADIAENEIARSKWKSDAAKVYTLNRAIASRRVQAGSTIKVAREFAQYDAIYFPHQLDFRGRVYAVPGALNPQGTDLGKGLLRFAEGDPTGTPVQRDWFFIHGANCYGVDKVSFGARCAWVEEHHDLILRAAADPLSDGWWTDADSPFCFLAWALEYAEFVKAPTTFTSHLPIAQDGSCNGLQHYSAMLRDPVGGRATNLIPSDTPQDIYGAVAAVVKGKLKEIARGGDEEAARRAYAWRHFGIDRKITKRPVMVLPYGGTQSSCQKYVLEAATAQIAEGKSQPFPDDEMFEASNWLGGIVWSSIGEVVVSARLAMGWLRDVAVKVSREGHPLCWTTPTGFPVLQHYHRTRATQIKTTLFGARYDPTLVEYIPGSLDARRQANGVAPNFVHSLDAAALMLTVIEAKRRGVTKFAMIHDSYGTTAALTPTLGESLREVFVTMYEQNDMLDNFACDVVPSHLLSQIPSPPFVGGLDLSQVRQSKYFFA